MIETGNQRSGVLFPESYMWAVSETKWVGQRDQNSGPLLGSVVSVLFSFTYFRNLHQHAKLMTILTGSDHLTIFYYELEIFIS